MRIFHHYSLWEDWQAGLFATTHPNEQRGTVLASRLLGTPVVCGPAMLHVVQAWPVAAEVNLTNTSRNWQAWIGQATCCYFCGVPEYITKRAWWTLSDSQRDTANDLADEAMQVWVVARTPQLEMLCPSES
jgi:hypothetical protein